MAESKEERTQHDPAPKQPARQTQEQTPAKKTKK